MEPVLFGVVAVGIWAASMVAWAALAAWAQYLDDKRTARLGDFLAWGPK